MKKEDLKSKKSLLKGVVMGFAVLTAALVLLSGCGSAKSVGGVASQSPAYELTDDCALLHLYRPATKVGVAVSYPVHLDDEAVFQARYNSKTTIRITSAGLKKIWAQTESRTELPVDIQLGKEYYVRCRIGMGVWVGRPAITLMDNKAGAKDFNKIRSR